jgi:hypothetical protein
LLVNKIFEVCSADVTQRAKLYLKNNILMKLRKESEY